MFLRYEYVSTLNNCNYLLMDCVCLRILHSFSLKPWDLVGIAALFLFPVYVSLLTQQLLKTQLCKDTMSLKGMQCN